jgi:hypothetical protein
LNEQPIICENINLLEDNNVDKRAMSPLQRIVYSFLLIAASCLVLWAFVYPSASHVGINTYDRSKFLDMVEGNAYKPFVYRTLLPTTVRLVFSVTPEKTQEALANIVVQNHSLVTAFNRLGWETAAAFQYAIASFLMLACFAGFAHYTTKLTMKICGIADTFVVRSMIALAVLIGLYPFFSYVSYVYDPPQLFLFTLGLYFLATSKLLPFVISFALCCINKETAILLIPIYVVIFHKQLTSRKYFGVLLATICWYIFVKAILAYVFRANPGSTAELHLDHNIHFFNHRLVSPIAPVGLMLFILAFSHWRDMPQFYRVSILSVLPVLAVMGIFFGVLGEWRAYYEAYPIIFGMISFSFLQFKHDPSLKT